jgi:hypothetical protein
MKLTATETGLSRAGADEVPWQDIADALATICNPFSSAGEVRAALVEALNAGEVEGETGILAAILDQTAPRALEPLNASNEEISTVTLANV